MKVLLDTHAFLWFIWADPRLSQPARQAIEDASECFLSTVSLWEMCIKVSVGKLTVIQPFELLVQEHVTNNGFELLTTSVAHLDVLVGLEMHHRDPFDRLLIAQTIHEGATLVSTDSKFGPYNVNVLW